MDAKEATITLRSYRSYLTNQEYRTIRGQIAAGDIVGAMKGLEKLIGKKVRE